MLLIVFFFALHVCINRIRLHVPGRGRVREQFPVVFMLDERVHDLIRTGPDGHEDCIAQKPFNGGRHWCSRCHP